MKSQAFMAITADQRRSRHHHDQVPAALEALLSIDCVLNFERTAGDEIQGLLRSATAVVQVVALLSRVGDWRIGLGLGAVELPMPKSTREARGTAYLAAREAVESAPTGSELSLVNALTGQAGASVSAVGKNAPQSPSLTRDPAQAAETVLWLLRTMWSRRTNHGWEVAEMLHEHGTNSAVAQALQVSPSAVSQRVATAQLAEEARGRALAIELLVSAGLEP